MTLDEVIRSLAPGRTMTTLEREQSIVALQRVHHALTSLSCGVHYSSRDTTGQASTRRVQSLAAVALRGERAIDEGEDT